MGSNERAEPFSALTPAVDPTGPTPTATARVGPSGTQTATFEIAGFGIELTASTGAVTLAVTAGEDRDTYPLDPEALERWADGTARLLGLSAARPGERADFRAPFLIDVGGRAAIAFESVVTEHGVTHRLLIMGQGGRVASLAATADALAELVEAARGAALFTRARSLA